MAKVKINLPTGINEERTLISAFNAENNTYIIFDADSVGSMGLPIIMVSKLENNKIIKISNNDEWTNVKGFLKEIIAGVSKDYVNVDLNLEADELYYTQLTLPLTSFDALKNSYINFVGSQDNVINEIEDIVDGEPEIPAVPNDEEVMKEQDLTNNNPFPINDVVNPTVNNEFDKQDAILNNVVNDEPVANPLLNDISFQQTSVLPIEETAVEPTNVSNENLENVNNSEIKDNYLVDKEAFLKACENMFDALVAKFKANDNNTNNN